MLKYRKTIIRTDRAPQAIGPYSQAVKAGGFLFISGQIPLKRNGEPVGGDIRMQTKAVIKNISAIIEAAGGSLEDIVKTTIYIRDIDKFAEVNEAYGIFFKDNPPSRATVEVSNLPKGVDVEIEAVACLS